MEAPGQAAKSCLSSVGSRPEITRSASAVAPSRRLSGSASSQTAYRACNSWAQRHARAEPGRDDRRDGASERPARRRRARHDGGLALRVGMGLSSIDLRGMVPPRSVTSRNPERTTPLGIMPRMGNPRSRWIGCRADAACLFQPVAAGPPRSAATGWPTFACESSYLLSMLRSCSHYLGRSSPRSAWSDRHSRWC
jgi:hypothetical protein